MRTRTNKLLFRLSLCAASLATLAAGAHAPEGPPGTTERGILNSIADEGFNHSEIAETAEYLADQIGGRMTNSPAMRRAEHWTAGKLRGWGLKNVRADPFDFGRGWWIEASHIRMVAARPVELKGIPVAWTPPTEGVLTAPIIVAPMESERDLANWKGKLSGKFVLVTWPGPEKDEPDPPFRRYSEADIAKLDKFEEPVFDPEGRKKRIERFRFESQLDAFLAQEGALGAGDHVADRRAVGAWRGLQLSRRP